MRASFIVRNSWANGSCSIAFEIGDSLRALGTTDAPPTLSLKAFDASEDIYYKTPEDVPPEYLQQELDIHVPAGLQQLRRFSLCSLGKAVLIQRVEDTALYISPLVAMRALLDSIGTVNSALLQCDNGCMLLLRKAGSVYEVEFSPRSLHQYLDLPDDVRHLEFSSFEASNIYVTGSDVARSMLEKRIEMHGISIVPLSLSELDGLILSGDHNHDQSLALGAALAYASILKEAAKLSPLQTDTAA